MADQAVRPPKEWHVFVHTEGVGYLGTVIESGEDNARCAALSKYARDGDRPTDRLLTNEEHYAIYLDDEYDVCLSFGGIR